MHTQISEAAALLAIGLLNLADDEGRFEADAGAVASALFPRRALSKPVEDCLGELSKARWVVLYEATVDGLQLRLGQVINFRRHQIVNRPTPSSFPPPPKSALTEDSLNTHGGLTPPTKEGSDKPALNTHGALIASQEGREGKGKEGKEGDAGARGDGFVEVPSLEEVLAYCRATKGFPHEVTEETGRAFFQHYEHERHPKWTDGGDKHFQWQGKLKRWASADRIEGAGKGSTGNKKTRAQLEAELGAETDTARRKALREEMAKLAA